jgi:hypothetical protein
MSNQFEHLELPRINIPLPRRSKRGFGGEKRSERQSHGSQLLTQVGSLINRPPRELTPFGINPKLIFKIKLSKKYSLDEKNLPSLDLNLLAKEPKQNQAIVVFSSDNELTQFREKLKSYSGLSDSNYEYGYLDGIEEIVPLEAEDRIGRLLELEPLSSDELTPLDVELWHTGNIDEMQAYLKDLNSFLQSFKEYPGMRITDQYIGEYICLARVKLNHKILELLLEEDAIKEIDRRPKPSFESANEVNIPIANLPDVVSPPDKNCGVLIIDSGVQRGHHLIGPALGDTEVFPDTDHIFITGGADDGDKKHGGHGTGVGGIAIYGDVIECLKQGLFKPQVWLFSARVTNENNEYDPDLLLENQLEKAIDYFTRNYPNCKVINISLGDSKLVYQNGQKQFRLAAKIDEIAFKLQHKNIVFVISAGNYYYDSDSKELIRQHYPKYLLSEEARIIEPATSAIALSVGSLSMGSGSTQYPEDASRNAIAKVKGYPSPFTRSGFGVDGMIKPDLVDFGGDFILDRNKIIDNEIGSAIITLAKNYSNSLFKAYCGTSFSAPRVANIAAQLFSKYPDATSNLIRALIANAAELPTEIPDYFFKVNTQGKPTPDKTKILRIYGYGQTNFAQAAYSTENNVVLLVDDAMLSVGNFEIYEIPPLPPEFLTVKGIRSISVTLAFDPPTKHTRGDSYLGVTMEFYLFKNIAVKSIESAFVKLSKENEKDNLDEDLAELTLKDLKNKFGSSVVIDLLPGGNIRKKGTLQKGQIKIASKSWKYDGNSMYLVVSCNRKWTREGEIDTQRYALVLSINHSNPQVDLYNKLKLQTRINQRVRIR